MNNNFQLEQFAVVHGPPIPIAQLITDNPSAFPPSGLYPSRRPDATNFMVLEKFTAKEPLPGGAAQLWLVQYCATYHVNENIDHVIRFWSVEERASNGARLQTTNFPSESAACHEYGQRLALMKLWGEALEAERPNIEPARLAQAVRNGLRINATSLLPQDQSTFTTAEIGAMLGKSERSVRRLACKLIGHRPRFRLTREEAGRVVLFLLKNGRYGLSENSGRSCDRKPS